MKILKALWIAYNWPFDKLFDALEETWEPKDFKMLLIGSMLASLLVVALCFLLPSWCWTFINIALGSISGRASVLGWRKQ